MLHGAVRSLRFGLVADRRERSADEGWHVALGRFRERRALTVEKPRVDLTGAKTRVFEHAQEERDVRANTENRVRAKRGSEPCDCEITGLSRRDDFRDHGIV